MKILIVDDEEGLREILAFFIEEEMQSSAQVYQAASGNEAIEVLKKEKIDLCICDHNMPDGMGTVVMKYIIEKNLKTRFVLCSTVIPSDDPVNYPLDKVFSNIQKPEVMQGLLKVLAKLRMEMDVPKEMELSSDEFIPVTVDFLHLLLFAPSDVYVKLSDKKLVRCYKKNDVFDKKERDKYHSRSINALYLKVSEDRPKLLNEINNRIREYLLGNEYKLEDKLALTHHQLCEMIKLDGLTPEHQDRVKETIHQTAKIISQNSVLSEIWGKMQLMGSYPSQLYTLQVMIASLILKKLTWNSEATFTKLALGAFVQDITLDKLDLLKVRNYTHFFSLKEFFSEEDTKIFLDHPRKASEMVSQFKEIPPDVDRIVLEQHEMPNGNGFPKMLNANNTGPLSCLFILSGMVAKDLLEKPGQFNKSKFIAHYQSEGYNKGNYKEIFDVLCSIIP